MTETADYNPESEFAKTIVPVYDCELTQQKYRRD